MEITQFIPIDLSVLRIDILKPFDIYLKTKKNGDSYVLYSRRGTYFTPAVKENLLQNRVSTIYVPEDDRDTYQQYIEENLNHIISDAGVSSEHKSKVVYESGKYLMERLFENPRADMIARTRKTVDNIVNLILSDATTTRHLIRITQYDYYTYTHSVNVGVFSVAFARALLTGITNKTFYDLGLGFFLHDIGKSRIPREILNKRGPLDDDEWKVMKTHPELGYHILQESGFISRESAIIVLQHHERADGSGYPRGLQGERINLYGKICSLADVFDAMTTKRCYQKAFSPFEALNVIRDTMLRREFDKDFFEKFVTLFGPNAQGVP